MGPWREFSILLTSAISLESGWLEIWIEPRERRTYFGYFGAPWMSLEKPLEWLICTPIFTNNHIRSPRLAVSSQYMNVDKGGRQNRSVTLIKVLALRVGLRHLCTNVTAVRGGCGRICRPSGRSVGKMEDKSFGYLSLSQLISSS